MMKLLGSVEVMNLTGSFKADETVGITYGDESDRIIKAD